MLIQEFVSRFASRDEGSFLFEVLRRIGRVDPRIMMDADPSRGWIEWPPANDPSVSGIGVARA